MGALLLRLPIPRGSDFVAYVLLLCPGIWGGQNGLRGDHQHELRNLLEVRQPPHCPMFKLHGQHMTLQPNFCFCRAVVPIGACYAGTLWLGNAAYLYLSVSFIQMLKVWPSKQQVAQSNRHSAIGTATHVVHNVLAGRYSYSDRLLCVACRLSCRLLSL